MNDSSEALRIYPPLSTPGNIRLYPNEQRLFLIMAVLAGIFWIGLTTVTFGGIWLFMPLLYVIGLILHSYFITHLQGNGVQVSAAQFPDLHARLQACCRAVGLKSEPEFYLTSGNGMLNAFATRFLRRYYVVLLSDVVDALEDDEEALNFYIGHELGHISQRHLVQNWWISVAMLTPLAGSAYSRAREYTCDQYGLACCPDTSRATRALAVLAAGGKRSKTMNYDHYIAQSHRSGGFWMALNELNADYPWLCKRVARVRGGDAVTFPRRHWLAWALSALVPRTGFGVVGALIVYVYFGTLALAVGVPMYTDYAAKNKLAAAKTAVSQAYASGLDAAMQVNRFIAKHDALPATLAEAGVTLPPASGISIAADGSGVLNVALAGAQKGGMLYLTPSMEDGKVDWTCGANDALAAELLPSACQPVETEAEED